MTLEDDQDEEICNCAVCSKRSEQLLLRSTTFLTLFLILLLHLLMFIVLLFLYGYGVYLNSTSTALPNTLIAFAPLLAISQLARGTGNRLGATGTGTSSRRPRSIPKHSEEGCSNLRMRPQCSRECSHITNLSHGYRSRVSSVSTDFWSWELREFRCKIFRFCDITNLFRIWFRFSSMHATVARSSFFVA